MPNSTEKPPQTIRMCSECGALPNARCPAPEAGTWGDVRPGGQGCPGSLETWVNLNDLPEDVVEAMRAAFLVANTVDATAEELGEPAPGIKDDAEEQMREVLADGVVIGGDTTAASPEDTLG